MLRPLYSCLLHACPCSPVLYTACTGSDPVSCASCVQHACCFWLHRCRLVCTACSLRFSPRPTCSTVGQIGLYFLTPLLCGKLVNMESRVHSPFCLMLLCSLSTKDPCLWPPLGAFRKALVCFISPFCNYMEVGKPLFPSQDLKKREGR